jgi:hypothetical protein
MKIAYLSFEEAREFARSLGLRSSAEWFLYCRGKLAHGIPSSYYPRITTPSLRVRQEFRGDKPIDIPTTPHIVYRNKGWDSWGDWLDTDILRSRKHLPFEEAREFARSLGLEGSRKWFLYCKGEINAPNVNHQLPKEIPRQPHRKYKEKGWVSWEDWLDRKSPYRSFEEARGFARSLGFAKYQDWLDCYSGDPLKNKFKPKLPKDIPRQPHKFYRDKGWIGPADFLGYGDRLAVGNIQYRSFEEARGFARSLGLKSHIEWRLYCRGKMPRKGKIPQDIHSRPATFYQSKGWENFEDWLGIDDKNKK